MGAMREKVELMQVTATSRAPNVSLPAFASIYAWKSSKVYVHARQKK